MAKEIITLSGMMNFFKEDLNTVGKGELKYKADFVLDLRISEYVITAKVRASMKDKCYNVNITVNGDGGILLGHCECPRGNWICSHMAATAIYVNKKGMSKTDLPNAWLARPKKAAKADSKTFADFFPSPNPQYRATPRDVTDADREFLHGKLSQLAMGGNQCPLQWMTGPEPQEQSSNPLAPHLIEDIIEDFIKDKRNFLATVEVTEQQIHWLSNATKGQRNNYLWGQYRKLRLTGSNFGDVIKACERQETKKTPIPQSLLKKLRGEYSMGTKDSIMWGQMHEDTATKKYIEVTGNVVEDCGLFLLPCGFLGSSPDGIIKEGNGALGEKGVLEIKCPWSHRNITVNEIITKELKGKDQLSTFYLTASGQMNSSHNYWHQVQGHMVAAGVNWAHFVIWTTVDIKILKVNKDPMWEKTYVPMLKTFYINELLPSCYIKDD